MIIDNYAGLIPGLSFSTPAFQLFQPVYSNYISDDFVTCDDFGVIVGVFINPPGYREGWWYWVLWLSLPGSPYLEPPVMEEAYELHLRGL